MGVAGNGAPFRALALAAALIVPGAARGEAPPDPAAPVLQTLGELRSAYERKDLESFLACFSTAHYQGLDGLKDEVFRDWSRFSYRIAVSTPPVVDVGLDKATATVSAVMSLTGMDGRTHEILTVTAFGLVRIAGKWLISRREFLTIEPLWLAP